MTNRYCLLIFFCCVLNINAQNTDEKITWLTGTVLNTEQEPVKKAVIFVDSVMSKTKTDKKGRLEIGIKEGTKFISAYSKAYGIKTVPYQGDNGILITFLETNSELSEENLEELGFNTSAVMRTIKKPKDYSKYLNMYQLIKNEVPGAMVTGTTIRLRGNALNSVNAGQDPLILVDGNLVGSIEQILPIDVASVRVIRDEGTSIYGSRGANGVILIKMKK